MSRASTFANARAALTSSARAAVMLTALTGWRLGVRGAPLLLLAVASCHRSPAPESSSPLGSASQRAAGSSGGAQPEAAAVSSGFAGPDASLLDSGVALASSPRPAPRFEADTGCARPFAPSGDAERDLKALHDLCSPGLAGADAISHIDLGGRGENPIAVDPPRSHDGCIRIGAIAEAGTGLVLLELLRGSRVLSAVRTGPRGAALLPSAGPICFRATDAGGADARLLIRARRVGSGDGRERSIAIAVWQSGAGG